MPATQLIAKIDVPGELEYGSPPPVFGCVAEPGDVRYCELSVVHDGSVVPDVALAPTAKLTVVVVLAEPIVVGPTCVNWPPLGLIASPPSAALPCTANGVPGGAFGVAMVPKPTDVPTPSVVAASWKRYCGEPV